eukprot:TRINITY_DN31392_c0_g1_i1.p1 TRINITY_DN31392_c0_g1~~TRINITY_DN31392_c0_g1_i1.p1  ORF type:complete len:617 (-),score=110.31 TRINITY_DN31392_c0_g1_i1:102-1916(-)
MAAAAVIMAKNIRDSLQANPLRSPAKQSVAPAEVLYSSKVRERLNALMRNEYYELAIGIVVLGNVFLMVIDLDASLACGKAPSCKIAWVEIADYVLLAIYTCDLACALFAQRSGFWRLRMNYLDLLIVLVGYIEIFMTLVLQGGAGLSMIRMLRICRVLRIVKLLRPFAELYKLVMGFLSTLRAIFWGFVMIMLLLLLWSIILLQVSSSLDLSTVFADERFKGYWCEEALRSTDKMVLLLWQTMITGDSWGACTLPIILKNPGMVWLFAVAFVTISIGFTNLILAVIVDNANAQQEADNARRNAEHKNRLAMQIEQFKVTFEELDEDNSHALSMQEIMTGFDDLTEFSKGLEHFGIDKGDLADIFDMIDADDSGDISYDEFISAMFRSQRQDSATQLLLISTAMRKLVSMLRRLESKVDQGSSGAPKSEFCQTVGTEKDRNSEQDHEPTRLGDGPRELGLHKDSPYLHPQTSALEFASLELRLQNATLALHAQSLALIDETRALTVLLEQAGIEAKPKVHTVVGETLAGEKLPCVQTQTSQYMQSEAFATLANLDRNRTQEDASVVHEDLQDSQETLPKGINGLCGIAPCWLHSHAHQAGMHPH